MSRSLNLPASFAAEMTRVGGSFPRYVLGIDYDGTLKYYSDIDIGTSELNADGKITSWGQLQLQAKVGSIGGHQNITLSVEDADLSLVDDFTDWPGIQTRSCYIYMFYDPAPTGGGWADRITLFKGVIGPGVKFDEKSATWSLTLIDIGKKQNPDIGQVWTKQAFPSMNCSTCGENGQIIPIVHGDPRLSVRGCAVERPGAGRICETELTIWAQSGVQENPAYAYFNEVDLWFRICEDAMWMFDPGEQCVMVGSERVCGRLHDTGLFEVYDWENGYSHFSWDAGSQYGAKTSWVATGRGSYFVADGKKWLTLPKGAFSDWTNGGSGYQNRLRIYVNCGGWRLYGAEVWASVSGSHVAFTMVGSPGSYTDPCPNNNFEFIAVQGGYWGGPGYGSSFGDFYYGGTHGLNFGWPVGTFVWGKDPYVYIFNYLPSESIDRLYTRSSWRTIPQSLYTINLNDKSYNTSLGRAADDEGVTSVSFHGWWEWGSYGGVANIGSYEWLLADVRGSLGDPNQRIHTGDALSHPVDVIEDYLRNPLLGNTPVEMFDEAAFDEAKDLLSEYTADIAPSGEEQGLRFATVLGQVKKLNDHVQELALHSTLLFFWDMGMATVQVVRNLWLDEDTVFELNESNQAEDSFSMSMLDLEKTPTELEGEFMRALHVYSQGGPWSPPAGTYLHTELRGQVIVRRSKEAELFRPRKTERIKLWHYQEVWSVNYVLETLLRDRVNNSADVTFTAHLDAMHLQPGDLVNIRRQSGTPKVLLHNIGRVESVSQSVGDPRSDTPPLIKLKTNIRLTNFMIEPAQFYQAGTCDVKVESPLTTTPVPVPDPATTTVIPTSTTVTIPPATTLPPTTTVNPSQTTTTTTSTTTTFGPCVATSGNCSWQYQYQSYGVCGFWRLVDSDCSVGENCYPPCPQGPGVPGQCIQRPCIGATTTFAPTTTTTFTTPYPALCANLSCVWTWSVGSNGIGSYILTTDPCSTGGPDCTCGSSPPAGFSGNTWSAPCSAATTTTTTTSTTTATPTTVTTIPGCIGWCAWHYNVYPDTEVGEWVLFHENCPFAFDVCTCCPEDAPTEPGTPNNLVYLPCKPTCSGGGTTIVPTTTTTTTSSPTDPPVTTTVTTSTTTAAPTTTTTESPHGSCRGQCWYYWEELGCSGFCHYEWNGTNWEETSRAKCLASNAHSSCTCDPFAAVVLDPYNPRSGNGLVDPSDPTQPANTKWVANCVCSSYGETETDTDKQACGSRYVMRESSCSGTDTYCQCPNPPVEYRGNSVVLDCMSFAEAYITTTTTTTTTTTAAPDPCDDAPGAPCACGCAGFMWDGITYTMTSNDCTGGCSPPVPPASYVGDNIVRCCS